jgi:hypothetical protein
MAIRFREGNSIGVEVDARSIACAVSSTSPQSLADQGVVLGSRQPVGERLRRELPHEAGRRVPEPGAVRDRQSGPAAHRGLEG